jgi:hypothetical protein
VVDHSRALSALRAASARVRGTIKIFYRFKIFVMENLVRLDKLKNQKKIFGNFFFLKIFRKIIFSDLKYGSPSKTGPFFGFSAYPFLTSMWKSLSDRMSLTLTLSDRMSHVLTCECESIFENSV